MPHLFDDAIRRALATDHAALALTTGSAYKYPAEVAPFAAADDAVPGAMDELHALLHPGEEVWIYSPAVAPPHPGLRAVATLTCLQMSFPEDAALPALTAVPKPLTCADATAMLALTDIAFPGFFRPRTCEMGRYFGFWQEGHLVAMGGERLNFTADGRSYREISGLCTHPEHRGRGYGVALLAHLLHLHRASGQQSWLHTATTNPAQHLYTRLGFVTCNIVNLRRIARASASGVR